MNEAKKLKIETYLVLASLDSKSEVYSTMFLMFSRCFLAADASSFEYWSEFDAIFEIIS
jgi:hypothetical protein